MTEIQAKHTTNNHVLNHLDDIVERKTKMCQEIQEIMKDEVNEIRLDIFISNLE